MRVEDGTRPAALGERFSRAIAMTTPLEIASGEGVELVAADGTRYLDFISGYGVTNTGHCNPRVVAAIREQAEKLLHVSTVGYTDVSSRYAERLCGVAPIADAKLFYTNSGTEAVEAALKLSRYATGRPNVLAFAGAFHGRTLGALSVSSSKARFRAGHEPLVPGTYAVPYPRRDGDVAATLAAIDRLFLEQAAPERVAAAIVEPVLGEGGYVVAPNGFLAALRALCDEHGIVLVVDEVQSGFGRTGRLFACEWSEIEPDLMTVSKGIASGLPMGALVGRADLLDAWQPGAHGTTFGGNPIACAAAAAILHVLEDEAVVENAAERGSALHTALTRIAAEDPATFVEVRGRGLMLAVELRSPAAAARLREELLARGVVVSVCGPESDAVRLSPPLVIDDSHVARFLSAFGDAVAALDASATEA